LAGGPTNGRHSLECPIDLEQDRRRFAGARVLPLEQAILLALKLKLVDKKFAMLGFLLAVLREFIPRLLALFDNRGFAIQDYVSRVVSSTCIGGSRMRWQWRLPNKRRNSCPCSEKRLYEPKASYKAELCAARLSITGILRL
jgi:hypothetical protein